jgi:hypothetical protein
MNQVDSQRYLRPAENTMDAFKRLAGDAIWTPFEKDKDASPQAKAEHELFVQMADNYDRNAKPSSTKGYNAFQKAWCQEAGRRMFADLEQGGNNKPAIRYKTRDQLQEYCDYLKELESMATETTIDESSGRHDLMSTLRQARLEQSEPIVRQATPVHYAPSTVAHIPLGHPLQMANVPWYSHNVNRQQSVANVAPYRVHYTPPHPHPRPDQAVCQRISDGRRFCAVCAYPKEAHRKVGKTTEFGKGKCRNNWCALCQKSKAQHQREAERRYITVTDNSLLMGRNCVFTM